MRETREDIERLQALLDNSIERAGDFLRRSVDAARQLKPSIPLIGNDEIPLHDEIELEMLLE